MSSHVVLLLVALTIVLVHAKGVRQIDDEYNGNNEETKIFHSDRHIHQPQPVQEILLKLLLNEQNNQRENDRILAIAKRARAIVKGDPREFMG